MVEGLFYFHGPDGLTYLKFYTNGNAVSIRKSTKFDQVLHTFPWLSVDSEKVHFSRGVYRIDEGNKIRIRVVGEYGKMDYHGRIIDADTLELFCHCRVTNYKKLETYLRFSEDKHIIHFEMQGN